MRAGWLPTQLGGRFLPGVVDANLIRSQPAPPGGGLNIDHRWISIDRHAQLFSQYRSHQIQQRRRRVAIRYQYHRMVGRDVDRKPLPAWLRPA